MPAEVIATVHRLAKVCKKYKGIIFTVKDGNIINDNDDPAQENIEIAGVNDDDDDDNDVDHDDIQDNSGVHKNNIAHEITGVPSQECIKAK